MGRGREDIQRLHQMLPWENWVTNKITDVVRDSYMEKIWMKALTKNIQKKALVQKRSAIYTVMQNIFIGKLHNGRQCLKSRDCISSTATLGCKQIYVLFV